MFHDLQRFVTTFRELEKQKFSSSHDEEKIWNQLKDKLSAPALHEETEGIVHKTIVVASFYPQAGASFLAANYALSVVRKGIPTVLAEHPNEKSYFYFSLDMESRTHSLSQKIHALHHKLQIKTGQTEREGKELSQVDIVKWFFATGKGSSVFIIDVSSAWRDEIASNLMDWADEVWFVFDSDLPRLARTLTLEKPPETWNKERGKIKVIANKWNDTLGKKSVLKRIEGTLSLWGKNENSSKVDRIVPCFEPEKVSRAHVEGKSYCELYTEEIEYFEKIFNGY